jgi:hypothetical protein
LIYKLLTNRLFVISENKIFAYNFNNLEIIDRIDTYENPNGIFAISGGQKNTLIAYPDGKKGYIRVRSYGNYILNIKFIIYFINILIYKNN